MFIDFSAGYDFNKGFQLIKRIMQNVSLTFLGHNCLFAIDFRCHEEKEVAHQKRIEAFEFSLNRFIEFAEFSDLKYLSSTLKGFKPATSCSVSETMMLPQHQLRHL